MDYSKDKQKFYQNMDGHNPNDGENQIHFEETISGNYEPKIMDSSGVEDGLSSLKGISVKNAEDVCYNQRPKGNTDKVDGSFVIGVS